MRISGIVQDSIVDGPGIRFVVFTQGCSHQCPGCQNPHTHDPSGGYEESIDHIISMIGTNHLLEGVTLSGGDPLDQIDECLHLVKLIKTMYPNLNIWCYTGYTYEHILANHDSKYQEFLSYIDVLVDGLFVESLKSYELQFKGSSNQRLIDVPRSLHYNEIVLYQSSNDELNKFSIPRL